MEEKITESLETKEWREQSVQDGSSGWMLPLPRMTRTLVERKTVSKVLKSSMNEVE